MANENARRDANRVTTALGVTNDAAQEVRNLLIDPATGALLVTASGGGLPPGTEICDADGDTCVETERTPDDDTIRFKAFNVDIMTATSTNFDIFTVDLLSTRAEATGGTTTSFNTSVSPYIGLSAAGDNWFDGVDVYVSNLVTGVAGAESAWMNYQDFGANFQHLIRVNASDTIMSSAQGTVSNTIGTNLTQARLQFANATDTITVNADATGINIDVENQDFFLNEGTTSTGTGTATAGQSLVLQNSVNGEAKWGDTNLAPFEVLQTINNTTVIVQNAPIGTEAQFRFDTTIIADPRFTLDSLTGDITCNVAGRYEVIMETSMFSGLNAPQGIFGYYFDVNNSGLPEAAVLRTHIQQGDLNGGTIVGVATLAVNDVIRGKVRKIFGGQGVTNILQANRIIIKTI
jgi:hypothetical protein